MSTATTPARRPGTELGGTGLGTAEEQQPGFADRGRDAASLTWDLTVHHLRRTFGVCIAPLFADPATAGEPGPAPAGPTLAGPGEAGAVASDGLAWVRLAAVRHAIDDIGAAVRRLEDGTYGACQHCESTIPVERLRDRPTARWCPGCQP